MKRLHAAKYLMLFPLLSGALMANPEPPLEKTHYFNEALELEPNIDNGRKLYKYCVTCHGPEGWGNSNGAYPQIAGQLKDVIIKQLDDIRKGNRDNPIMRAFTSPRILPGPQEVADIAGYIASLPMTPYNGQAGGFDLQNGQHIYERDCASCHGDNGEGDTKEIVPLIQGQHFNYLLRQFNWIRDGRRKNADKKMVRQIRNFTAREQHDVLAYTASLRPPADKLAKDNWTNPDYKQFDRRWQPDADYKRRSWNRPE
jgi:cytochrome c553